MLYKKYYLGSFTPTFPATILQHWKKSQDFLSHDMDLSHVLKNAFVQFCCLETAAIDPNKLLRYIM